MSSKYDLRFFTIVIGATLAALLGGTTNSLNSLSTALTKDLSLSDSTYQLLASLALIGLYFAIPAGACFDRFGAFKTAVGGTLLHAASFLAASYCGKTTFGNVLLGAALLGCGFGAGAAFITALSTSIQLMPKYGGVPMAIVSAAMSLSITFVVQITKQYNKLAPCTAHECWRNDFRVWAITIAIIQLVHCLLIFSCFVLMSRQPGALMLFWHRGSAPEKDKVSERTPHIQDVVEDAYTEANEAERPLLSTKQKSDEPVSLIRSLRIVTHGYFWFLFFAYFAAIGSCLFVLVNVQQIYAAHLAQRSLSVADKKHYQQLVDDWGLTTWSICNALANLLFGSGADVLHRAGWLQHRSLLAIVMCVAAFDFALLGAVDAFDWAFSPLAYYILLCGVGLSFGCYLTMFPIITGAVYGPRNFGTFFGYVQLASSSATFVYPQISIGLLKAASNHTYFAMHFFCAAALVVTALALRFGRQTEFRA